MGIFDKGVQKTKQSFFEKLSRAVAGRSRVDDDVLDAIEEALVASDAGVDTTLKIIVKRWSRWARWLLMLAAMLWLPISEWML